MHLMFLIMKTSCILCLKFKHQVKPRHMLSPVSDAVVSVVAQSVVVGSPPGDCGPGPTAHFTPQGNTVATLTCYIADRDEELWGSWEERKRGQR